MPNQITDALNDEVHPSIGGIPRDAPVAIEVRGVSKTFRVPEQRIDTLKERATHPLSRVTYRELHALQDITFDVRRGEFFGIVGRNGSGKSSLLKILASIYRADTGRVRMAGRVAPFIELGVGFNPELTARENGVLNGVLMGLTRREARNRLEAVLDFAELHDFVDLKLKNYSSGMMVRLAFSIMVQADADIMLVDEVLAVGDAAFAQKCMDVFHEKRRAGKTIVLVTHDMNTVQALCHRAMLIHDGSLVHLGSADETALRYYRLNFAKPGQETTSQLPTPEREAVHDLNVRVLESHLRDRHGVPLESVETGEPLHIDVLLEAARHLDSPFFSFHVTNAEGAVVFAFTRSLERGVGTGQRIRLRGEIENRLVAGRYHLDCWIRQDERDNLMGIQARRLVSFVVYGIDARVGYVIVEANVEPEIEEP